MVPKHNYVIDAPRPWPYGYVRRLGLPWDAPWHPLASSISIGPRAGVHLSPISMASFIHVATFSSLSLRKCRQFGQYKRLSRRGWEAELLPYCFRSLLVQHIHALLCIRVFHTLCLPHVSLAAMSLFFYPLSRVVSSSLL